MSEKLSEVNQCKDNINCRLHKFNRLKKFVYVGCVSG